MKLPTATDIPPEDREAVARALGLILAGIVESQIPLALIPPEQLEEAEREARRLHGELTALASQGEGED
jgi:hypothetical protein